MNRPHANCGKECLECVLEWYRLGSSEVGEDDDVQSSDPDSPPPTTIVRDSLSPDDLGTQVQETEFDDGFVGSGSGIPLVGEKRCGSSAPETPCTKYANAFLRRMEEKKKKCPEKGPTAVDVLVDKSPSASMKRFWEYYDNFKPKRLKFEGK